MSHELEMNADGTAKMAWVGEVPWHGLGQEVAKGIGPAEIAKVAGADWSVEKRTLWVAENEKDPRNFSAVPKQRALVRSSDDRVLTIVGEGWEPVQNSEAFEFFNRFCEAGDMHMDTAGVIDNRGVVTVFALAKLKDGFTLPGGDEITGHLLFSNPHQFGRAAVVEFTPIRVVCNNTLTMALAKGGASASDRGQYRIDINHKKKFDPKVAEIALGLAEGKLNSFKEAATFLTSKPAHKQDVDQFFRELFPINQTKKKPAGIILPSAPVVEIAVTPAFSRTASRLVELLETQPGAEMSRGTWWSAFNAVTAFTDHEYGRTDNARLGSAWFGTNRRLKIKALNKAIEYANA